MSDRTTMKKMKSILKKTSTLPSADSPISTVQSQAERNRSIAIHHAKRIQAQKDMESEIVATMETLLEYPLFNPASLEDIHTFKTLLSPFQPTDYDALLVERRAAGRCAYVLCPNPSPSPDSGAAGHGRYRIVRDRSLTGIDAIKIVERSETEIWCSEECARKALYVRVQLSEEPAWVRAEGAATEITLLEEKQVRTSSDIHNIRVTVDTQQPGRNFDLPVRPKTVQRRLEDGDANTEGMAKLSQERGDKEHSSRPGRVLATDVHERQEFGPVTAPSLESTDDHSRYDAIEGYQPDFLSTSRSHSTKSKEADEVDDDWNL